MSEVAVDVEKAEKSRDMAKKGETSQVRTEMNLLLQLARTRVCLRDKFLRVHECRRMLLYNYIPVLLLSFRGNHYVCRCLEERVQIL